MLITTSVMMKTTRQQNLWLQVLQNPIFILVIIVGSPFYMVHKVVQWASIKTDKKNETIKLAVS